MQTKINIWGGMRSTTRPVLVAGFRSRGGADKTHAIDMILFMAE